MPIKAVVFDRDGVLSSFDIASADRALKQIADLSVAKLLPLWMEHGHRVSFPRTTAEEEHFWAGFWQLVERRFALDQASAQVLRDFNYADYLLLYADALDALRTAKSCGLKTGVLSNFALASLDESLQVLGIADLIDVACAATVIGVAKPDPESYRTVCRSLDVLPSECLYYDDEIECVRGGQTVGMQVFLVDRRDEHEATDLPTVADLSGLNEQLATAQ